MGILVPETFYGIPYPGGILYIFGAPYYPGGGIYPG